MAKIKNWSKKNDVSWQHDSSEALVQVVPSGNKSDRCWDVYVESRNPPKFRKRVSCILLKAKADALAKRFMRRHPNG